MIALTAGGILVYVRGWQALVLLGLGAFFVLFYTYPLKYIALGEISVLIVWGPLMIGGGYFVITGVWDWNVVIASLPYALGVTGVIFGKHIDKYEMDKAKGIHTLPGLLGESLSRYTVIGMLVIQYLSVLYLIVSGFFTPILLIVLFAIPAFMRVFRILSQPTPHEKPEEYPADVWPNWYVAAAFYHNRRFGLLFLGGLVLDTIYRVYFLV